MLRRTVSAPAMLCMVFILALATAASAQYGASIQGTISDQTGAAVKGATVTVTNQATGVAATTTSTDTGFYRVPLLPPGKYTVKVEAASFGATAIPAVDIAAETVRGLNVTMRPAAAKEVVTVTGEAPPLQTENANVDGAITTTEVQRLPQYGRDPFDLVRLAPGVFGDGARSGNGVPQWFPNTPGGGGGTSYSIFNVENLIQATSNGQRLTGNNITIDGTSVNDLTWAGSAIITPNQESIQEMKVVSSTYSAEDGRATGVQIKVVSKSGTNSFHGSGFFKYDEPGMNAYNKWGGPDGQAPVRVPDKLRQFGGSIGGPIKKDKLFFFFSYEGNRTASSSLSTQYVETPQITQWILANRAGTMIAQAIAGSGTSALPGSAPRIAQVLTPNCADFWWTCQVVTANGITGVDVGSPTGSWGQYVPMFSGNTTGGGLDGIPDMQKVVILNPLTSHGNQFNARVDFVHGKNLFAVSTYYTPRNDVVATSPRPNDDLNYQPRNKYLGFLWNRTFSPTLLNEFRFNATRFFTDQYSDNGQVMWGLPYLMIEGIWGPRITWGPSASDNSPLLAAQNQFEFRDNVSKMTGRHALKFGMQLGLNQDNNNTMFGAQRPAFSFYGPWNYLNGTPIYEGINADPVTGKPYDDHKYWRQTDWAVFFQDDIKLRPNLTVNLGLRYEYFAPLREKYDRLSNLVLGTGSNPLANATVQKGLSSLYEPDRNNFAPRIGFAWSPARFDNKTVFRGGFGMAYYRLGDNELGIARVNPPYIYRYGLCCGTASTDWGTPFVNGTIDMNIVGSNLNSIYNYGANPALANNINPSTNLPLTGFIEIWGAPQKNRTPYTMMYSLDMQQELPAKFVMTLGYQGSQTRKLLRIVNLNNVYQQLNPSVNAVYFPSTDSNANYNALNVTLNRPFANGLQILSKYTWSKSIDQGTGEGAGGERDPFWPANHVFDTGPSDFDATHNLMITALWDIPIFRNRDDFLGRMLGGWHLDPQFQFHSGFPWSPISGWEYGGVNCLTVPSKTGKICPNLPTEYLGGGNLDHSNSTFMQPGGSFPLLYPGGVFDPNGWKNYFVLGCPVSQQDSLGNCYPGIRRNAFRGPSFRQVNLAIGKTTKISLGGDRTGSLDIRANIFNLFNTLNLIPIGARSNTTIITDPHFGRATGALSGRVVELQARFSF